MTLEFGTVTDDGDNEKVVFGESGFPDRVVHVGFDDGYSDQEFYAAANLSFEETVRLRDFLTQLIDKEQK